MYKSWSPVVTFGGGGIALIVMSFTALGPSVWGIPVFFVGVGYLVKAGFEAYQHYVENEVARIVKQPPGRTLRQLERDRKETIRMIWGYRNHENLRQQPMRKLARLDEEIAKRKENMNAK